MTSTLYFSDVSIFSELNLHNLKVDVRSNTSTVQIGVVVSWWLDSSFGRDTLNI